MTNDDQQDIVLLSNQYLAVYNKSMKLLGFSHVDKFQSNPSFRRVGLNKTPELGLHIGGEFNRLGFNKNIFSLFIYLLFVGLTASNFLIISLVQRLVLFIVTHRTIFHRFLFDSPNGILLTNPQGKIRYANNLIAAMLGLPQSPQKGEYLESVLNPYPEILDLFKSCMKEQKSLYRNLKLNHSRNSNEIEISIYPFGIFGISCSLCLIELKIPVALKTSSKIETWSRAVQKIAHDIKTPLSTVNLNLKVLQTRLDKIYIKKNERKELADDIAMMRTELENIQSMTKNFLKFTNLDKPHFQAFYLKEVIDDSVKKYRSYLNPDQDIQVTIDADTEAIWADPQQIELVFNILIENALSALQGKGMIQISASLAQYLDKDFSEYIEIEVADTGPGIREIDKSKIFEPYFTTKSEGTGMGLTIAKKIVEDHGCTIDVHSRANFGAVFVFSLPVVKEEENDG
jgi:nitrogen fixation/metabolism regulation signal transduction histidine kinase